MVNDFKAIIANFRQFKDEVQTLKGSIAKLQSALDGANQTVTDLQKEVAKWEFKNAPRLKRIQEAAEKMKTK